MNVRLLRRVAKHIKAEPRRYSQGSWCDKSISAPCGTMACIAGWAMILGDKLDPRTIDHDKVYEDARSRAMELLEIDSLQAVKLFCYPEYDPEFIDEDYEGQWPRRFAKQFFAAKTLRGKATAAVARIEHFIKTRGAE